MTSPIFGRRTYGGDGTGGYNGFAPPNFRGDQQSERSALRQAAAEAGISRRSLALCLEGDSASLCRPTDKRRPKGPFTILPASAFSLFETRTAGSWGHQEIPLFTASRVATP